MMAGPNGNLTALPYPVLPPDLSDLPTYSVTGNIFIVDDTGGNTLAAGGISGGTRRGAATASAMMTSTLQAQANTVNNLIEQIQSSGLYPPGGGTNGGGGIYSDSFNYPLPTNGLWLETYLNADRTNLWLRLHGTIESDNYQLLSISNPLNTNWDLGDIIFWAEDGQNDFPSAVPMTNATVLFRAHHANPVMALWDNTNSIEPSAANNDPGKVGAIGVYDEIAWSPLTNDTPVHYTISGTAQNGVDYSNITGVATIPAGQHWTFVFIRPLDVGLKPDRTIVLTLVQNTNYLIDPPYLSVTNMIFANADLYPTARGDIQYPCPNTWLTFNLTNNASDPRGLPLTCSIVAWPIHGTLDTTNIFSGSVTYEPNNCYEGQDNFTFTVSDGQFTSAPATVTLFISSQVYANPVTAQTCRGTLVRVLLSGGAYCDEAWRYAVLSSPPHGTLNTNAIPYITYTPNDTNFTGTDSFNYQVTDECGYSVTGAVSITVGGAKITPNSQTVMTGTNQPVAITLSASDYESCNDNTNYYAYTIISGPTHGTLRGTPPNVSYTPNPNYEGLDSFQFNVGDGVWTSGNPATVTIYVVAGPVLMAGCNPFGTGTFVQLDWSLDNAVQQMEQQYNFISDYKIYRASVSGGPYMCIYTNTGISQMSYLDTNVVAGQTNYYVATFEFTDNNGSGKTYESPRSNKIVATGQYPNDLIAPDAIWNVWDISNTNRAPNHLGDLRAPFSSQYPSQYPDLNPWPNTYWPEGTTWSNHIVLIIPTNIVDLSQVKYSIAIDNDYWLYLNNSTNYIDMTNHDNFAAWEPFKTLAPGLHQGTNNISVVIRDRGDITYFSMVVTTNTCGQ
jgi:hypothetical protein